jgi:hypothetical protein
MRAKKRLPPGLALSQTLAYLITHRPLVPFLLLNLLSLLGISWLFWMFWMLLSHPLTR